LFYYFRVHGTAGQVPVVGREKIRDPDNTGIPFGTGCHPAPDLVEKKSLPLGNHIGQIAAQVINT